MTKITTSPIDVLAPKHCVCGQKTCRCSATQRALYFVMNQCPGIHFTMEQREWCLAEIGRTELHRGEQYVGHDDTEVARGVILAWRDYARDQGVL